MDRGSTGEGHRDKVCMAVFRFIEKRKEETFFNVRFPDKTEHKRKAVDLAFESATGMFVMEHTQIESFPEQILDDQRLIYILGPLEKELENALPRPGHYKITIECGTLKKVKNAVSLRKSLAEWILKKAPLLKTYPVSERCVKEAPPGVPFVVLLCRYPGLDGKLMLSRYSPEELEQKRRVRVDKAINDKCPKLYEAKGKGTSILVLESNDIALANYDLIAEALRDQFSKQLSAPDEIYLVETEISPWMITILREGLVWFPDIQEGGPHEINPSERGTHEMAGPIPD
jgi:hypothetical protein